MNAGLTRLSDDELAALRERIMALSRGASTEQRAAASAQLNAIDLEQDRRLSAPIG
jgi:hypothetical protein